MSRRRFLTARGWQRELLARQLECHPQQVRLVTDKGGKPRLAKSDLCFSAARSADLALFAASWAIEVGVDLEATRKISDIDRLAARFCSPAERRLLQSRDEAQRQWGFYQCWTRKEAYGKGIGTGLSFPLRDVDVWNGSSEPAIVAGWSISQVDLAPGFAAALARRTLDEPPPSVPHPLCLVPGSRPSANR